MTFPKPRADLKPNTADFERLPLVKPTGFREYDARWLYPAGHQPDGAQRHRPGPRHAGRPARGGQALRRRPRLPLLFGGGEAGLDHGPAGRRRGGARHRPGAVADGLFRPVRARRGGRGHGHGQPQRQRLDRHQDGLPASAHLRPGRDDGAQGHRARRRMPDGAGRALPVRARHGRALHRGAHRPSQAEAQAQGGRSLRQRHGRRLGAAGAGGHRLRGGAARLRPRLHLPALQPQPRRHEDAARHERGGAARTRPTSASASTATATAAAWSTTRATRSSPTRSASCWRATSRRGTTTPCSSPT